MATPPTFSSGAVLTAAQMNSVGLWKVASGSLSTAVTNFQGCFTSDYRDYLIVGDNIGANGAASLGIKFLIGATPNTTANYYYGFSGIQSNATASNINANGIGYIVGGVSFTGATSNTSFALNVLAPQVSGVYTHVTGSAVMIGAGAYIFRQGGGAFDATTQFDGIQFNSLSAVTLSGNVTIYGYRN